ncbi:MAG: thiamine phosphate synthase [Bacteroidetes bacterium]|nr:MAG: thiamine phosphate synthase [Bacteroidota bacterium]
MRMLKSIAKLQFITQDIPGFSHIEQVEIACSAGVRWVQLRMKEATVTKFKETAIAVNRVCKKHESVFIVNDNVDVALKVQADGVHLGKKDMLPSKARLMMGLKAIIGGTANSLSDMLWCTEEGCDYIGVGPYRFTSTKKNLSPVLQSCGMLDLIEAYSISTDNPVPIIAIGGIQPDDVQELIQSEYHGIAVSSAIAKIENPAMAVEIFINNLKHGVTTYS